MSGGLIVTWIILLGTNYFFNIFTFELIDYFVISGLIVFFSLLCDLDHPISKITRVFYGAGLIMQIIGVIDLVVYDIQQINGLWILLSGLVLLIGTFLISQSNGWFVHRGASHTWWFIGLSIIPLYLIGFTETKYLLAAFVAGWSHLLFDTIPLKILSVRPA